MAYGDTLKRTLIETGVVAGLLLGAFVWLKACHDPDVLRNAALRAAGDTTDARVARLAADAIEEQQRFARAESVRTREAEGLRHTLAVVRRRADSLASLPDTTPALLAAKDVVIAAQDSVIADGERRIAFYRVHLEALRDSIIPTYQKLVADLTHQRDAWRHLSQRHRPQVLIGPVRLPDGSWHPMAGLRYRGVSLGVAF